MRITGGMLRGRTIRAPGRGVRPTQDRVREALFSSLGQRVEAARVLDLFAGSGALGLEAWSRGAAAVCWVEKDGGVFRVLKDNVESLCVFSGGEARCVRSDALAFLRKSRAKETFDIVLADPPYELGQDLLEKTLLALAESPMLARDGVLVFEQRARGEPVRNDRWLLKKDKRYGDTRLLTYLRVRTAKGS